MLEIEGNGSCCGVINLDIMLLTGTIASMGGCQLFHHRFMQYLIACKRVVILYDASLPKYDASLPSCVMVASLPSCDGCIMT